MNIPENCWVVDFEFCQPVGEVPRPICMVARNFHTRETLRIWLWDEIVPEPSILLGKDCLYVAYLASSELSCHLALGWGSPARILDLYVEFRLLTCGVSPPFGSSLLGASLYFDLPGIASEEKKCMRELAMRGGPFTESEKLDLLDYCESDVTALAALLQKMWPNIDLPRALIRGRFMMAVAKVERTGIPVAADELALLLLKWDQIRRELALKVDGEFGVYDGTTFKAARFREYCERQRIRWPKLESGEPCLKWETFKRMACLYPQLLPLCELRRTLGQMRLSELSVGSDGRNRYLTGVFGSKTGRNQPSSSKAIFGPARWIRHLIKPASGMAVAYIDYSQQEFGIAAAQSGDEAMMEAYRSGDPYLEFAKMAGSVPPNATKQSHPVERDRYKVAALGILMGMGAEQIGVQTMTCGATGARLLRQHKEFFSDYWEWSDAQVDRAMLGEVLTSEFGWALHPFHDRPTTYRNFKLQANGADMLRLAVIAITERDIRLCAMIHDAVLIEAPIAQIGEAVFETRRQMGAASRAVLSGFEIGTDSEIIRFPERVTDSRGVEMWKIVSRLAGIGCSSSPAQFAQAPLAIWPPRPV